MSSVYRLVVTGSRDWADLDRLGRALDWHERRAVAQQATGLVVVHGAAYPSPHRPSGQRPLQSADWLAHLWATTRPHLIPTTDEPHPADWTGPCRDTCQPGHRRERRGRSICPAAGNYRNQLLVDLGATAAVGFRLDGSRGTGDCLRRLDRARIPTQRVTATTPNHIPA